MADVPVRVAVRRAVTDPRRTVGAVGLAVLAVGAAAAVGTGVAYFAAGLVVFTVWMAWFVATAVAVLRTLGL